MSLTEKVENPMKTFYTSTSFVLCCVWFHFMATFADPALTKKPKNIIIHWSRRTRSRRLCPRLSQLSCSRKISSRCRRCWRRWIDYKDWIPLVFTVEQQKYVDELGRKWQCSAVRSKMYSSDFLHRIYPGVCLTLASCSLPYEQVLSLWFDITESIWEIEYLSLNVRPYSTFSIRLK